MSASRLDILAFIPKLEAGREDLVDEIMLESRHQTELDHKRKDPSRLNALMAELAALQATIAVFVDEADRRS